MKIINSASETYINCSRSILLINCDNSNTFEQHNIDKYADYLFRNKVFAYQFRLKTILPDESLSRSLVLRNNPLIKKDEIINIQSGNISAILIGITDIVESQAGYSTVRIIIEEISNERNSLEREILIENFLYSIAAIEKEAPRLSKIRYRSSSEPLTDVDISESENFIVKDILADTLSTHTDTTLSNLYIDDSFDIHLPLYPQIKIEMAPLPKSLYILLLLHPEGFTLKRIHDYSNELTHIYCTISGRRNPTVIRKIFDSITNPTINSLHKNLSIIRKAFLSKLRTEIAEQYIPTQGRDKPHRIPLNSNKIELPSIILCNH